MFWRNVLPPSSILMMEAAGSSETLITIYRATRWHSLEDSNIHDLILF
jgi:hypothetical protein